MQSTKWGLILVSHSTWAFSGMSSLVLLAAFMCSSSQGFCTLYWWNLHSPSHMPAFRFQNIYRLSPARYSLYSARRSSYVVMGFKIPSTCLLLLPKLCWSRLCAGKRVQTSKITTDLLHFQFLYFIQHVKVTFHEATKCPKVQIWSNYTSPVQHN